MFTKPMTWIKFNTFLKVIVGIQSKLNKLGILA